MTKIRHLSVNQVNTPQPFYILENPIFASMKKSATKKQKSSKRGVGAHSSSKSNPSKLTRKSDTKAKTSSQIISPLKIITRDFAGTHIENTIHLSNDIIISLGKDHKIQTINKSGCKALGYPRKRIIGENWFDRFVTPSMRMSALKSLQKLFSGEEDSMGYIVIPIINKKEEEHLIEWECLALKDSEDSTQGILLSGRDITQQKLVEKELIQSEWDMALAQKIARLGSWVYNMSTHEIRMSNETHRIFETNPQAFQGTYKAFLKLIHPDDRQRVEASHQESFRTGKGHQIEYRIPLLDGAERIIYEESKVYLDDLDNPLKARGIVQDVTERKQAEEKLKLYQEQLLHAEKLSSMGKLSASIAHEINNPLFGIRNVLERTKMCVPLEEADERFIDMAISETDRIAKLTRRLNKFFSPTRENKEPVQINRVLEEIALLTQKELADRGICLKTHYSDALPEVSAVPGQIKQVALNLFQNAMDAIPETGGEISLSTYHQNSHLYFTVEDNGIGMNEETRRDIFEPFFTTKSKAGGTGLGLWVTHSIVQSHGGILEVETQYGKGTSFTVSLPIP
jgi:PAS domain S-box-containing protein